MKSDDDCQSLSPQTHCRRLKRSKKFDSKTSKGPLFESVNELLLFPQVDFVKSEAFENGIVSPDLSDHSDSTKDAILSQETLSQGFGDERETRDASFKPMRKRKLDITKKAIVGNDNKENVGIILEKEMISPSFNVGSSLAPLVNSPMEEDLAPLLGMNLEFDSASFDDSSSDEDYNDKENVEPHPLPVAYGSMYGGGDFANDFIDEADEEDDSDNDLLRFQENEVEDIDDLKELNDMIATEYEDNEKRNKLHQKWLEQQHAAGTENLMQRLQYGRGILPEQESETDDEDEEFDDEAKEDSSRINTKKAKQIILQLLPDKEDAYLSDEDNDTQSRHALSPHIREEEHAAIVSPAADESSREVFGLIKKLNIASENKRKPKPASFFDSVLRGRNNMQVSQEAQPMKISTAKYSSSQTEPTSQSRDAAIATSSRTSLLDTLKRSSSLSSQVGAQNTTVDLMKDIFTFRALKNPTKIEGRS